MLSHKIYQYVFTSDVLRSHNTSKFVGNSVYTLSSGKAKQKIMCVTCFIMKKIKVGRSDLTFYF